MLNIFEYLDYRAFIRDFYDEKKRTTKSMSVRKFAMVAGFSSWNFMKLVVDGKRNLSRESMKKFIQALRLKGDEAKFFELLVQMNQQTDPDLKNHYYEELMTFRGFRKIHPLEAERYEFLSKWYVAVVHELVALPDFDSDPRWIVQKIRPAITEAEAKRAVEVLAKLGLIKVDPMTGKARHTKRCVATPDLLQSLAIFNYQKEMIALAQHALRKRPAATREVSGLTTALSREQFDEAKRMIRDFRRRLHARFSGAEHRELVCQMNFQIFSLSEVDDEK